jgi:class 3 adenylate cyclase/tetratricopeptide (TPR) repeat protein
MRADQRTTGGGVAAAIVREDRAVAVLGGECRHVGDERLDLAVEGDLGEGKGRGLAALGKDEGGEAGDGVVAGRGDGDGEFGHLVLRRLDPAAVARALFEQAIAVAESPLQRIGTGAVVGIDDDDESIEEAPPLARRAQEELVHRRRLPDEAQMIGERTGRRRRRTIDAEAARLLVVVVGRVEADAKLDAMASCLDLDRDGEAAAAADPRALGELGPPEAATGREQRQRLKDVGLAGAVLTGEHDHARVEREIERRVGAEIGEDQPPHRRRGEALRARRDGAGFGIHCAPGVPRMRRQRQGRAIGQARCRTLPSRMDEAGIDVADWLNQLGLSQYQSAFAEHEIDAEVLPQLTAEDLKELGVSLLGHRRKLLTAIDELRARRSSVTSQVAGEQFALANTVAATPERRHLTVLFCDLVGSTALSARLDPEDLREVIRSYHAGVAEIVHAQGGFVAQYLGDGALVYFGFPVAHEDDAERAVRAALLLRDAAGKVEAKGTRLEVRSGVATGLVVVGDRATGSEASHEPQVMGETPNRAARLQALAEAGGILIDAATRTLVGRMFDLAERQPANLKGFDRPVVSWNVLGLGVIDSRFEALRSAETPLIGREEELELLVRRWQQAKAGRGRLVMIAGEPGLGKSRLVSAFEERVKSEAPIELRYFCSPQHTSTALYPIISYLRRTAGFAEGDTPDEKIEKLRKLVPRPEHLPLVADLLSLPVDTGFGIGELAPQEKREKLLAAWVSRIEVLSQKAPVFILIDDAHWIDPTTQELLDLFLTKIDRMPVLAITTCRPEFQPAWIGQPNVSLLTLNRLSAEDCSALVRVLIAGSQLSSEMIEEIAERTDGIPLFAEELSKTVMDTGNLASLKRASNGRLEVPATLHASLIARLDHLGSEARETAQAGSVIGREFSYPLLIRMLRESGLSHHQRIDAALDALVKSGLVFVRGAAPDAVYTFKHALVQDAAYSTLLRTQRQKLHAALAPIMAADATVAPEVLAYHYAGAGEPEQAAEYWFKAGEAANERSANTEAIRSFQNALEIISALPDTRERKLRALEIISALCNPLIVARWLMPETTGAIVRAAKLAGELGVTPPPIVLYHQWLYAFGSSKYAESLRLARLFSREGGPELQTRAHVCIANSLYMSGEPLPTALAHIEQALSAYDRKINSKQRFHYTYEPRCVALSTQSLQLVLRGFFDQATAAEGESARYAAEFDHPQTTGFALAYKLLRGELQRDYSQREEVANALARHAAEHKIVFWSSWADIFAGFANASRGAAAQGIQMMDQSLQVFADMRFNFFRSYLLGMKGRAYEIVGDFENALACVAEGITFANDSGERVVLSDLIRLSGDLHLAQSGGAAAQEAESLFVEAIALAQAQGSRLHELRAATSLARLCQRQGRHAQARDVLDPVYSWFREAPGAADLLAARAVLDQLPAERESA